MLALLLLALGVVVLLLCPVVAYFQDKNGLRQFPTPSWLAGLTPFWRIYHNYHLRQFDAINKAHLRLGPHVRIAPNHLSVAEPEAVDTIYGHGANFLKDVWYDGGAGASRTMADTRDKAEHQAKRKRMAHLFAYKTLADMEPVIADRVQALLRATDARARAKALAGRGDSERAPPFNVRRFVNYFTIDVITYILFGTPARCLERGNDTVPAKNPATGRVYTAPLIDALHDSMRVAVPIGYVPPSIMWLARLAARLHPMFRSGERFADIVYHHVTETHAAIRTLPDPGDHAATAFEEGGFLRQIMYDKRGQATGLPLSELLAECSGMVNAGSDTTSTALANCMYLLSMAQHRDIRARLQREIDPVFAAAKAEKKANNQTMPLPAYDALANLPFLRACIDETLRLRPSSAFGLPREVPAGGRYIAGRFVAGGVSVSVPTYSLLHHPAVFAQPGAYRPQRWTDTPADDPRLARMKKYFLPFSTGPRACIGRNIAYFEMVLVVAALVHYFDFGFAEPAVDGTYKVLERLNANPDELWMYPTRRAV
ncbi:Cytochrome P450 [Niveomyces insectorum RCEF 264]|uniref:Cytochrome P450 n=1 Tax=Niveomyces insectorum RCEF 264 TaxID=1081102 RepID=A0A167PTK8_9HYPO|nr:Cytochrome P450 [Niveomyces insectorum RCEF 264]